MLKINKRFLIALLTFTLPFGCVGCSGDEPATYDQISGAEAKALMDSESGYIILDAREQDEYDEGHIPGAILIPEYEIADRAKKELHDKNQLILVYCRSGRRSKIAAEKLVAKLQTHITANYYTCTDEILAGLGKMYVADERFKKNFHNDPPIYDRIIIS